MKNKYFLFTFLILFCVNTFAQESINYTTKQGLPSNHIYDLEQDANGFMWFATNRGLVKFDGEKFKTFTIKDGLPNNDTWKLDMDLQGRLWYFSKSNRQGYIKNDSIYSFYTEDSTSVSPVFVYKTKNNFWFYGKGLDVLNLENKVLKETFFKKIGGYLEYNRRLLKLEKKFHFKINEVSITYNPDLEQTILVKPNNIYVFDSKLQLVYKIKTNFPDTKPPKTVFKNGLMSKDAYFIIIDEGILFINLKAKTSKYIPFKKLLGVKNYNQVFCKALQSEIQVSVKGFLLIFDYDFNLKEKIKIPENIPNFRSYKDDKGNVWTADFINGITLLPNIQQQTKYNLPNKKVQKIGKIDNTLFAGVYEEGFYSLKKSDKQFVLEDFKLKNTHNTIYKIKYSPVNKKGFLVSQSKTWAYKNKLFSPIVFNNFDVIRSANLVYSTGFKDVIEFDGALYTVETAILRRNLKTKKETILLNKEGLYVAEKYNNQLFIGGSTGLYILKKDTLVRPPIKNHLLNTSVLDLQKTKNYLLVGTDGRGVYLLNDNELIHLKATDGLSIQKIIAKEKFLWLATQKGVKKLRLDSLQIEKSPIVDSFYETDGLLQNNTNDIYLEDGFLYVASDIGLAKLNLNSSLYKQDPNLYFKTKNDTLILKKEQRDNISISFSTLDYVNQNHLDYEYRLLPTNKKWTRTTTKTLHFASLKPNFYTLEVKVIDQHNNQKTAKQYIKIIPQWWQTIWANIVLVLVIISLLGLFVALIKKRIQKKEHEAAERDKQIAGLELQALRSQMNPHFVHNSLNAIQYYIQRNEVDISEDYLVKFSKLIRMFFEYSRRQNITLKDEIDLLSNYLEIEKLRFEEKLSYHIKVDPNIDTEERLIPTMLLQPIVENAINHGLFHKPDAGKITILINYIDELTFTVTIKDDGIGINKAKEIQKKSSEKYQSRSSEVLQERLELFKQSKEWDIDYEIKDLSDLNKDQTGTIVSLTFKQYY